MSEEIKENNQTDENSVIEEENDSRYPSFYEHLPPVDEEKEFYMQGGMGQPTSFFMSPEQFQREQETIFTNHWIPVDHISRVPGVGDFTTVNLGDTPVLIVRNEDGIQAFHNICRHRGIQLTKEETGCAKKFVCPYHHWTYDNKGNLTKTMGTLLDHFFDPADYGLLPIKTTTRYGIIFIAFSDDVGELDDMLGDFPVFANAFHLKDLKVVKAKDYPVASNWKLIMHNINEALHFPAAHSDLHRITDYDASGPYDLTGTILGAWQLLRAMFDSVSFSGESPRPPIPGIKEEDYPFINWIAIMPHLLVAFTSDYVTLQWAIPISPEQSLVRHMWLFHPGAISQPDFTYDDVFNLWDKVNYEDWELVESCHQSLKSRAWETGPYTLDEEVLYQFDQYVVEQTRRESPVSDVE